MFPWLWPPGFSDILSQQLLLSLPIPHTQMQQNKQNLYIPFPSMLPYNCCLQNSWSSEIVGEKKSPPVQLGHPCAPAHGYARYRAAQRGKLTTGAETPLLCSTVFAAPFTPVQLTSSIKLSAAMTVLYLKQIWEYWARQWYPSLKVYPEPGSASKWRGNNLWDPWGWELLCPEHFLTLPLKDLILPSFPHSIKQYLNM